MATPLGTGAGTGIDVIIYNSHASTNILKGEAVKVDVAAVSAADGLTEDKNMAGQKNDVLDTTVGLGGVAMGVALTDIPAGTYGTIRLWGLAQIKTAAAGEVVGDVMTVDASGTFIDAAAASHEAPCAILKEASTAGGLHWAFVDFISASFSGAAAFYGTAY